MLNCPEPVADLFREQRRASSPRLLERLADRRQPDRFHDAAVSKPTTAMSSRNLRSVLRASSTTPAASVS